MEGADVSDVLLPSREETHVKRFNASPRHPHALKLPHVPHVPRLGLSLANGIDPKGTAVVVWEIDELARHIVDIDDGVPDGFEAVSDSFG